MFFSHNVLLNGTCIPKVIPLLHAITVTGTEKINASTAKILNASKIRSFLQNTKRINKAHNIIIAGNERKIKTDGLTLLIMMPDKFKKTEHTITKILNTFILRRILSFKDSKRHN